MLDIYVRRTVYPLNEVWIKNAVAAVASYVNIDRDVENYTEG
jgi:hypothetical protein